MVERQIKGDTLLSFSGSNPQTAWLAWANYIWADGKNTRSDRFNWRCPEDVKTDGVHPSNTGKAKVAGLIFNFFKSDTTSFWFRDLPVLTGVFEYNNIQTELSVFPNPAKSFIQVDCKNGFEIYNSLGQLILNSSQSTSQIDISTIPNGVYVIRSDNLFGRFIKLE